MEISTDENSAITLLYVEDDVQAQQLVIEIVQLKFPCISLLLSSNGQDGLDIYTRFRPAIVVTDVRMPIIDGIQMAKKIKELNKDAQIIVLTATDEANYLLEAIDIGINNYVLKPINMDKFIAAIERCLDKISLNKQLKQKEEFIRRMAYFDYLTGLPNRQLFSELLNKSLAYAQRHNRLLAVCYLDLNGFKNINDTLGHSVGDQVLKEVAKRLTLCCSREEDTVARWGGDEFIILLPDINGPQEAASVAHKINESLVHPVCMDNHELMISISIGISLYPNNGKDEDTLIRNADMAMYCDKNKDRN